MLGTFLPPQRNLSAGGCSAATDRRTLRLLLAGDALGTWQSLLQAVAQRGHVLVTAAKPEQVTAILREVPIDAAVMDLQTWGSDVFHVARAIRAWPDPRQAQTLLLAIVPPSTAAGQERCLAAGIDWCCPTSIPAEELMATVERLAANYLPHGERPPGDVTAADAFRSVLAPPPSGAGTERDGAETLEREIRVFDYRQALHQCFDSVEILQQMAAYLLDHAEHELDEIRAAVRNRNRDALRSSAHQLKGTVVHLGAARAVLTLKRLEQLPWSDDLADAAAAVEEAARQVQQLKRAVLPLTARGGAAPGA